MQKFFSNKKLIIILIALIASMSMIAVSISVRNNKKTPPIIQQFGNDVVSIVGRVVSVPVNGIKAGTTSIGNLMDTYQENTRLKKQVDQLAQLRVSNQTLKSENKSLKRQLKLNGTLTDYTEITASVLTRSPANWQSILVVNKGTLAGVAKNMPVMAGSGLVGRVIEVSKTTSKVELISTDNNASNKFAVQITTKKGNAVNGIITSYDVDSGQLVMGQLNANENIAKGDKVITSGLGGLTPKGLLVGTVNRIKKDDYGLASSIYLTPSSDMSDLSVVTIINRTVAGDD